MEEEEIRIDVVKKTTHRMEILVYMGEELIYKHTIELNPEVFDEEDAEKVMKMWSQLIQMQTYAMGMWRTLAEKFYKYFFEEDEEGE